MISGTIYSGSWGTRWVKTPNVDKLIKSGVCFRNTYIA